MDEAEPNLQPKFFSGLIPDVQYEILSYLSVKDLLALRQTSNGFRALLDDRAVWQSVIVHQILPAGLQLPIPKRVKLSNLSPTQLKAAALYTTYLDHLWSHPPNSNRNVLEFHPEVSHSSVPMALLIPGTAGRYLVTITLNATIRVWEIDSKLRRQKLYYEWKIAKGYVLGLEMNSDPDNEATFAISRVNGGDEFVTLYHLQLGATPMRSELYHEELIGILKILRGDLIVSYRPHRGVVVLTNYRTRARALLTHVQPHSSSTILAVEVLDDYVITVQLGSIDIFEFPETLRSDYPRTPEGELVTQQGELLKSFPATLGNSLVAATIVPYYAPYPSASLQAEDTHSSQSPKPASEPSAFEPEGTSSPPPGPSRRAISILIRERALFGQSIHHLLVQLPPIHPASLLQRTPSSPTTASPEQRFDIEPEADPNSNVLCIQSRRHVRQHFFADIVVSASSGRGLWIENNTVSSDPQSNEKIMLFSRFHRPASAMRGGGDDAVLRWGGAPEIGLIDIGGMSVHPFIEGLTAEQIVKEQERANSVEGANLELEPESDNAAAEIASIDTSDFLPPGAFPPDSGVAEGFISSLNSGFLEGQHGTTSREEGESRMWGDRGDGTVRSCLARMPQVTRNCSYVSFDDSVGRIVIATSIGKVRIVDLASEWWSS